LYGITAARNSRKDQEKLNPWTTAFREPKAVDNRSGGDSIRNLRKLQARIFTSRGIGQQMGMLTLEYRQECQRKRTLERGQKERYL
jgi:hypothetical protein